MALKTSWVFRSRLPAQSPANPAYPDGVRLDMTKGAAKACAVGLPYPAPGVGSWIVSCDLCGFTGIVTAAGRRDDPKAVAVGCLLTRPELPPN